MMKKSMIDYLRHISVQRYLILCVYVMALIPLAFHTDFISPYVFVQTRLLYILTVFSLLPLIFLWIYDPQSRPRPRLVINALTAFLLVQSAAALFSVDRHVSFFGSWTRFGGLISLIHLYIVYLILITVLRSGSQWRALFRWNAIVASAVSVLGIAQYFSLFGIYSQGERVFATVGNPGFLAAYLLLTVGVTLYLIMVEPKQRVAIWAVAAVLQGSALLLTQTRSAAAAMLAALVATGITYGLSSGRVAALRRFISRRANIMIAAGIILLLWTVVSVFIPSVRLHRFMAASPQDALSSRRLYVWNIAIRGFLERPVFGWGLESFPYIYEHSALPAAYEGREHTVWFDRAHNEFLNYLAETGVIGAFAHALFLSAVLMMARRRARAGGKDLNPLLWFIGAYYIYLFFFFSSVADSIVFMTLAAFLYGQSVPKPVEPRERMPVALVLIAIIVSVGIAGVLNIREIVANASIRKVQAEGRLSVAVERYSRVWPVSYSGRRMIIRDLSQKVSAGAAASEPAENMLRFVVQLSRWSDQMVRRNPLDVEMILAAAAIHRRAYDEFAESAFYDAAERYINSALVINSRHPALYQARGLLSLRRFAYASRDDEREVSGIKALEDAHQAYVLAPHLPELQLQYYVAHSAYTGSGQVAVEFLRSRGQTLSAQSWILALETLYAMDDAVSLHAVAALLSRIPASHLPQAAELAILAEKLAES